MAADSKSNRRSSGGRSSDEGDNKRSTSRRGGGDEEGGGRRRSAAKGARKSAATGRKSASGGRKTATKKTEGGGGRKVAAKKAAGGRAAKGAAKGAGRRATRGGEGASRGRKAAAKKSSARGGRGAAGKQAGGRSRRKTDALSLLKEDHERVDEMLRKFERMKEGDERKQQLMQQILEEVRVHAQVEEELFYPALRTVLEEDGKEKEIKLVAEADVEHETVKWLMAELEGGRMESQMVDARMKVMGEYIRHHVEEEEGQIFRAAKRSDIDLEELGRQIDARKRELKGEAPMMEGAEGEMGAMAMQGGGGEAGQRATPPTQH